MEYMYVEHLALSPMRLFQEVRNVDTFYSFFPVCGHNSLCNSLEHGGRKVSWTKELKTTEKEQYTFTIQPDTSSL